MEDFIEDRKNSDGFERENYYSDESLEVAERL